MEESIEVVIAGYQRKGAVISPEEKKVIAYHEIGHALVAAMQKHSAPVHKITIIPRTNGALGYTMQIAENDSVLMKKEELFNKIVTITGGRSAEEIVFGSFSHSQGKKPHFPLFLQVHSLFCIYMRPERPLLQSIRGVCKNLINI